MGGWVGRSFQITKDGINLDIIEIIGLYLKIYGQLILIQLWVDVWVGGWMGGMGGVRINHLK